MSQEPVDAILVNDAPENFLRRRLIVELVEKARLPAMYPGHEHVEVGGLMAYAFDFPELYRYAAHHGITFPPSIMVQADEVIESVRRVLDHAGIGVVIANICRPYKKPL
jgi:hypothetical protein